MMEPADREVFGRSVRHAVETHESGALDSALVEVGWDDALASDPADAVSILFAVLGAEHRTCGALEHVVAASLELPVGSSSGILLPALGQWSPPGRVTSSGVTVRGLSLASHGKETVWVVAQSGDDQWATEASVADLVLRSVAGMDPTFGLVEVTGTFEHQVPSSIDVSGRWPHAVAAAQRAVSHQLIGTARTMLELTRLHALERVQFGQPISTFQAVRHRLADTLVAIESAEGVLWAAWEDDDPTTALVAKALAGRGAKTAARHCQQVLAGIGFTTEHAFHRYARSAVVLDQLFGGSRPLTTAFGTELLAGRRLPAFAPL